MWSVFAVSVLAVVVSVDIRPDALEMLKANGGTAWISDVYYSCVRGNPFAIVRSGLPEDAGNYTAVETPELTVYVPKHGVFEGDVPKISVFPRRTGAREVGVSNRMD